MPSLGLLVLFNSGTYLSYLPMGVKKWIFGFTIISTYLIPLGSIYFMFYQGIVKSLHMRSREERLAPLVIALVMYVFCYYLVSRIDAPKLYNAFLLSGAISTALCLLITTRFKISIHMVGTWGLLALVGFLAFHLKVNLQFYMIVAVIIAGLVGSARLVLKAHTPLEIYSGFMLGMSTVILTMLIY